MWKCILPFPIGYKLTSSLYDPRGQLTILVNNASSANKRLERCQKTLQLQMPYEVAAVSYA